MALTAASLCLLVGVHVAYIWSQTGDPMKFAENAAQAAEDERVREAAAQGVTDAIIRQRPDLVAVRPVILEGARAATNSTVFVTLVYLSLLDVHDVVVSREEVSISIGIGGLGTLVASATRETDADTAKLIPQEIEGELLLVTDNGFVIDLLAHPNLMRDLSWALPLASLVLFVLAIALASDRVRETRRVGIAASLVGLAFLLVMVFVRAQVLSSIDDPIERDAAAGILAPFLNAVPWWTLTFGGGGLLIAGWALLRERRGATESAPAADLAVTDAQAGDGAPGAEPVRGIFGRLQQRGAPAIVVGAGLVAALAVVITGAAFGGDAVPIEECNGARALCDRPLDAVVLATAHNAMAAADAGFLRPNQGIAIPEQLDAGIRGLQIDSYYGEPVERGVRTVFPPSDDARFQQAQDLARQTIESLQRVGVGEATGPVAPYLCHDACEAGATLMVESLTEIRQWLGGHPTDVLVFVIQDLVSPEDTQSVFEESGLLERAYVYVPGTPLPTLRQLLEARTPILVMAENEGLGPGTWYPNGYDTLLEETPFLFSEVSELASPASCEPNRGGTDKPLFLVNHW